MRNNNEGRKRNEKSESSKDLDDARENPNQVYVCFVCLNLKLRVILQQGEGPIKIQVEQKHRKKLDMLENELFNALDRMANSYNNESFISTLKFDDG